MELKVVGLSTVCFPVSAFTKTVGTAVCFDCHFSITKRFVLSLGGELDVPSLVSTVVPQMLYLPHNQESRTASGVISGILKFIVF